MPGESPLKSFVTRVSSRVWNSPTATTWASFFTRFGYGLLVLPVALITLPSAQIALWLLFRSLAVLQGLATLGFTPTFIRTIAYAMGGAKSLEVEGPAASTTTASAPNWALIGEIITTMRGLYRRIGLAALALLLAAAIPLFQRPIDALATPQIGWLACAAVFGTTALTLSATPYLAYLQGINEVARVRRWEAITSVGGILSSVLALLLGGGLLGLVIAEQTWRLVALLRNHLLCRQVAQGRYYAQRGGQMVDHVLRSVWPPAWRSGVGVLMNVGPVEASGFVYAQVAASPAMTASYLLALRIIRVVASLASAPFHSKIPLLARIWAEGDRLRLLKVARRSMQLAFGTFAITFVSAGLFGPTILQRLGASTPFPDQLFWGLLGLAFFAERYGATHIQLYSTTNHIVWHKAAGIAGIIFLIVFPVLLPIIDSYAMPLAMIAAHVGFFSWYSARYSYRAFGMKLSFELGTSAIPIAVLLVYLGVVMWRFRAAPLDA